MRIAKIRDRILAFVLDFLIYITIILIFGYFYGQTNNSQNGYEINGFPAFILFIIGIALWPVNEFYTGQTFGKKIVGLKVVKKNNKEINGFNAFLRFGIGIFDCFFLIGIIIASLNKNKQRIGDSVADTVVIDLNK